VPQLPQCTPELLHNPSALGNTIWHTNLLVKILPLEDTYIKEIVGNGAVCVTSTQIPPKHCADINRDSWEHLENGRFPVNYFFTVRLRRDKRYRTECVLFSPRLRQQYPTFITLIFEFKATLLLTRLFRYWSLTWNSLYSHSTLQELLLLNAEVMKLKILYFHTRQCFFPSTMPMIMIW
jgi:hypothetical protein